MKGSGIPVMGMMPMVIPAFWKTLKAMKANSPVQMQAAEDVPGHDPGMQDPPGDHAQEGEQADRPTKPSCSPTAVKMKSVCCSGT